MGNSLFSDGQSHGNGHENLLPVGTIVDGGFLYPIGIYDKKDNAEDDGGQEREVPEAWKFDLGVIQNLIIARKLAPFYKGLGDVSDINQLEERQQQQQHDPGSSNILIHNLRDEASSSTISLETRKSAKRISIQSPAMLLRSLSNSSSMRKIKQGISLNKQIPPPNSTSSSQSLPSMQINHILYEDAVECPICLLLYPKNINYTRCCNQLICTECFIQIKRSPDFSPACCPYCMESNFGVVYKFGMVDENNANVQEYSVKNTLTTAIPIANNDSKISLPRSFIEGSVLSRDELKKSPETTSKDRMTRSKSELNVSVKNIPTPSVIYSDDIRPRLQAFMAEQREMAAEAARRADIESQMQLGRLLLSTRREGRRRNRRNHMALIDLIGGEGQQFFTAQNAAQELEDMMISEAIRQSMLEGQSASSPSDQVPLAQFLSESQEDNFSSSPNTDRNSE